MRFEYRVINYSANDLIEEKDLDLFGSDEWDLVAVVEVRGAFGNSAKRQLIFKREL